MKNIATRSHYLFRLGDLFPSIVLGFRFETGVGGTLFFYNF